MILAKNIFGNECFLVVMPAMRVMQQNIEQQLSQLGSSTFTIQKMPLIILNGPEMMPLTLGLYYFATEQVTHYEYIITYSLLLTVPVLIMFLAAQKFFIKGLQLGAVKG